MDRFLSRFWFVPALLFAMPAGAQEIDATRRSFAFFDRTLTIEVAPGASGELHVVRGTRSRVEVAARASPGIATFALGGPGRDRLRLGAAGADAVEYIVVVPEHVQLHIQLPDIGHPVLADAEPAVVYRWSVDPALPSGAAAGIDALPPAYADRAAPAEILLSDLASIRRLAVRTGEGDFQIAASRPLQLTPGQRDRIEIRPSGDPIDLLIRLPAGTSQFTLRTGDAEALTIRDGQVTVACSPVTHQVLEDGRRRIDFSPRLGHLSCER